MPHVEVRKATISDCEALAPHMREADALEVKRSAGFTPLEACVQSVIASKGDAQALYIDGELVALFGIVRAEMLGVAVPWLLTSDAVERHRGAFFRFALATIDRWAEEHPVLLQMVDEEYVSARLFLQRLGFTIHPPVTHGAARAPFHPAMRSKHV
jgi:hypothetical protein